MKTENVGAFHSTQIREISVGTCTSNGTDQFGFVRLEYLGPAVKVLHFDWSDHFGWSDGNVPFHLTNCRPQCRSFVSYFLEQ